MCLEFDDPSCTYSCQGLNLLALHTIEQTCSNLVFHTQQLKAAILRMEMFVHCHIMTFWCASDLRSPLMQLYRDAAMSIYGKVYNNYFSSIPFVRGLPTFAR